MQDDNKSLPLTKRGEWSAAQFVKDLRKKENATPKALTDLELAYLELVDGGSGEGDSHIKRQLTYLFRHKHEVERLAAELKASATEQANSRQLRRSPETEKRLQAVGLHRYTEAQLKEMKEDFEAKLSRLKQVA